ncbi:copper chaperone PCu(A)C [Nocardioides terrisoli]|uniref:hypothetical protein n=1 Tax=Nocardioides terrisoli TaxID=3388267 RepID=UPI00287BA4B1|nr:hypothetical protein [Nocardioides marmorisolisilvae]
MKSHLRRRLAGPALLLLIPLTAACGFGAQTDQVYQAAAGSNNRSGEVDILNAVVVSKTPGTGTFAGTLVNKNQTQADQLVSVSDAVSNKTIKIPPAGAVNLATSGKIRLSDPSIKAGGYVELTLQFASGQTTKINTPVFSNTAYFAKVPVGPLPTKSPSKSPSNGPSSSPSGSASPSSGASPSATPSQ